MLFRGLHALIWHGDDADRQALERFLPRLGLTVATQDPGLPPEPTSKHDLLFFDADLDLPLVEGTAVPRIALVGSETPTRLEWLLAQQPATVLVKPIRPSGLYATLAFAFANFDRLLSLERDLERLQTKLRHRRLVLFAVLRLMNERGVGEDEAFAHLRRSAMHQRTTIEALSAEILAARPKTTA